MLKLTKRQTITPKNLYEITTTVMHGDADFYTNHSATFEVGEEPLLKEAMTILSNLGYREYASEKCVLKDDSGHWFLLEDTMAELVPYDKTCDMYRSALRSWKVTYYDKDGVEFDVQLEVV